MSNIYTSSLSVAIDCILLLSLIISVFFFRRYFKKYKRIKSQHLFIFKSPIKKIQVNNLDPIFETDEFGPTKKSLIKFLGKGDLVVEGGTSDAESWILACLSKISTNMFEFGTCTGKTTYLWSINSPENARITTITLRKQDFEDYSEGTNDNTNITAKALEESVFEKFIYENEPETSKVTQLFGDSKHFNETPFADSMDLIFIDGSHAYSYIKSDTEKALKMLRKNGIIIWHDYRGKLDCEDVFLYLNELSKDLPLVHIGGTCMVAYRKS